MIWKDKYLLKERFYNALQKQKIDINDTGSKNTPTLFLLTADESLWKTLEEGLMALVQGR